MHTTIRIPSPAEAPVFGPPAEAVAAWAALHPRTIERQGSPEDVQAMLQAAKDLIAHQARRLDEFDQIRRAADRRYQAAFETANTRAAEGHHPDRSINDVELLRALGLITHQQSREFTAAWHAEHNKFISATLAELDAPRTQPIPDA